MEKIESLEEFECMMKERYERESKKPAWRGYALIDVRLDENQIPVNKEYKKRICAMRALALRYDNLTVMCSSNHDDTYDYQMIFWYNNDGEKADALSEILPYLSIAIPKGEGKGIKKNFLKGREIMTLGADAPSGDSCPTGGNWCD